MTIIRLVRTPATAFTERQRDAFAHEAVRVLADPMPAHQDWDSYVAGFIDGAEVIMSEREIRTRVLRGPVRSEREIRTRVLRGPVR